MGDKRWKGVERQYAALYGTTRTPLSGGNSRHGTRSDTLEPTLYIEVKYGSGCPKSRGGILKLFQDTEEKAALERKRAVLILHAKFTPIDDTAPVYVRARGGDLDEQVVRTTVGASRALVP